MEKTCYRCDAPISENATFCQACGAPQIRVSAQELTPAAPPEPQGGPPEFTYNPPGPAFAPGAIRWKLFLRTAWPMAVLAGICVRFAPLIGFLVLLPISVIIGIRLYARSQSTALRRGQGARLGMSMGAISFVVFAALTIGTIAIDPAARQEIVSQMTQAASQNPDPARREQLLALVHSPEGFATLVAAGFIGLLVILLVFTAAAGAVAATMLGPKKA